MGEIRQMKLTLLCSKNKEMTSEKGCGVANKLYNNNNNNNNKFSD
jgi:hypothetical protein